MSLDFVRDLTEKLGKQGLQYHLVVIDPNSDGGGNVHTFENLEIEEYPVAIESLGESTEILGAQYEDFIKWIEKEMTKDAKREKKLKKIKEPIDPSI